MAQIQKGKDLGIFYWKGADHSWHYFTLNIKLIVVECCFIFFISFSAMTTDSFLCLLQLRLALPEVTGKLMDANSSFCDFVMCIAYCKVWWILMDTTSNTILASSATIQKFHLRFVASSIVTVFEQFYIIIISQAQNFVDCEIINNMMHHHYVFL